MRRYKMLAVALAIATAVIGITGCGKKKEKVPTLPEVELTALTLEQCEQGKYYVKHGDEYYALQSGVMNWTPGAKAESLKVLWFGTDEALIPTLYSDDRIIYIGPATFTSNFQWTRFQDDGYGPGIRGVAVTALDKYYFTKSASTLYPNSSAFNQFGGLEDGTMIVFDKINGTPVVSDNMCPSTTFAQLEHNAEYKLDAYIGTNHYEVPVTADTRAFSWIEDFETTEYSLNTMNYAEIQIPLDWKQGYYMINDAGLFRYVDQPSSQGPTSTEFNEKYYAYDENGALIKGEDGNPMSKEAYDELQKQLKEEEERKYREAHPEEFVNEGNQDDDSNGVYKTELTFDASQSSITVYVTYSDPIDKNIETSDIPSATLVDPQGNKYDFAADGDKTLSCKNVDTTISNGKWTVEVRNANNRTFNVSTEIGSGNASSFVHTGNGTGSLTYHIDNPETAAGMKVTWENTSYVAEVKVTSPEGKVYDESAVVQKDDGYKILDIGDSEEGDYKVEVDGTELGRVRVTVGNLSEMQLHAVDNTQVDTGNREDGVVTTENTNQTENDTDNQTDEQQDEQVTEEHYGEQDAENDDEPEEEVTFR